MWRQKGARVIPVSSTASLNGSTLLGGPGRLMGWSLSDGSASSTLEVDNNAAAPAAGATIASLSLPNGVYQVQWYFDLSGTPGAADIDNVGIFIGATQIDQSANTGTVGIFGPFTSQANVVFGPLTLAAKALGNAAAGTNYRITMKALNVANAVCNIKDGGMIIATPSVGPQNSETQWLGELGIRFDTAISVQTTQGTISGTLWIVTDLHDHDGYTE